MSPQLVVDSVTITVVEGDEIPADVDARVLEEDTYRVLSADVMITDSDEDVDDLLNQAIEEGDAPVGSVLVSGEQPTRLLAIIHDLNEEPSWREEWIAEALDSVFCEVRQRKFTSLAIPLLGTVHGAMTAECAIVLLGQALQRAPLSHLKDIYLMLPEGTSQKILAILASEFEE